MEHNNIKTGNRLEITLKKESNDEKSVKTFISIVEDVYSNNRILIHMPISYGRIIKLKINEIYSMLFFTDKGMYKYDVKVLRHVNEGDFNFMLVELVNEGIKIQRREFYRFNCILPFKFEKLDDEKENIVNYNKDRDIIISKGIIKDISAGGIRFISNESVEVNDYIKSLIVLKESYILILGKVLYKQEFPKSDYKYQYRVAFIDIQDSEKDFIIRYIFEEQRRIARKSNVIE